MKENGIYTYQQFGGVYHHALHLALLLQKVEDCLALKDKFPSFYKSLIMAAGFVGRHTKRKASAILMDQTFENAYNKPAKSNSGIVVSFGVKMLNVDRTSSMKRYNSITFVEMELLNEYGEHECTMIIQQVQLSLTKNALMQLWTFI